MKDAFGLTAIQIASPATRDRQHAPKPRPGRELHPPILPSRELLRQMRRTPSLPQVVTFTLKDPPSWVGRGPGSPTCFVRNSRCGREVCQYVHETMADDTGPTLSEHQWRLLWEERLDSSARRRIWRASLRGEALEDADEAAVAIEFARRHRRAAGRVAAINAVLYLALLGIMAAAYEPPTTETYWFLTGVLLLLFVANPLGAVWWRWRLRLTEDRNRLVLPE